VASGACATVCGGAVCGAAAGVASAAGLNVVVVVPRPVSFSM
jgi:hypothetical protein